MLRGRAISYTIFISLSSTIKNFQSCRESRRERLAIFGGTFDPPHVGHIIAARAVRHACSIDRMLFVVANQPWQKTEEGGQVSSAEDRLAMVQAAVAKLSWCEASSLEIDRGGNSYTADTLEHLGSEMPDCDLFVVVGSDIVPHLNTWERPEAIKRLAEVIVVERPGSVGSDFPEGWSGARVAGKLIDISSTQLREWIKQGRPTEDILPAGVAEVIAERRLYGG